MHGCLRAKLALLHYPDAVLLGPSTQILMGLLAPVPQIQLTRRRELPQLRDSKRLTELVT